MNMSSMRCFGWCWEESVSGHDCLCFWLSRGWLCEDPQQICQNITEAIGENSVKWKKMVMKIAHDLHSVKNTTCNHTRQRNCQSSQICEPKTYSSFQTNYVFLIIFIKMVHTHTHTHTHTHIYIYIYIYTAVQRFGISKICIYFLF